MRKRLLISLAVLAALLVAGYVALWVTAPGPSVTPENVDAIRVGMTEREVQRLMGGPGEPRTVYDWLGTAVAKAWSSDSCSVTVLFGPDGAVVAIDRDPTPPSFIRRIRQQLGL